MASPKGLAILLSILAIRETISSPKLPMIKEGL